MPEEDLGCHSEQGWTLSHERYWARGENGHNRNKLTLPIARRIGLAWSETTGNGSWLTQSFGPRCSGTQMYSKQCATEDKEPKFTLHETSKHKLEQTQVHSSIMSLLLLSQCAFWRHGKERGGVIKTLEFYVTLTLPEGVTPMWTSPILMTSGEKAEDHQLEKTAAMEAEMTGS